MNRSITGRAAQQIADLQEHDLLLAQVVQSSSAESGVAAAASRRTLELQTARIAMLGEIPEPWRSQYERIAERYGRAVVPVQGQTCLGCYACVPSAATPRTRTTPTISRCECCGRLLLWAAHPTRQPGLAP